ncbi:MAG: hypothetical protein J4F33_07940 [Alphaproteobacteria bacterium]|nr:hypothetical protein [Alphaproteobacteria bacterium]
MARDSDSWPGPRLWILGVGLIILLIFLYFYQPFEEYVAKGIRHVRSDNVIFWFASAVGVIGYFIAHWQTFRRNVWRRVSDLDVETLVFETLQVAILIAVILCAGATLQAVVMLSEHLIGGGAIIDSGFGDRLLSIILLVILAILFYLLHHVVRAFRHGWQYRRQPPRKSSGGA